MQMFLLLMFNLLFVFSTAGPEDLPSHENGVDCKRFLKLNGHTTNDGTKQILTNGKQQE